MPRSAAKKCAPYSTTSLAAADIEATEIAGDACIEDYPDVSMISDYAMQPVVTMVDHSVINGITDTSTDTHHFWPRPAPPPVSRR